MFISENYKQVLLYLQHTKTKAMNDTFTDEQAKWLCDYLRDISEVERLRNPESYESFHSMLTSWLRMLRAHWRVELMEEQSKKTLERL